MHEDLATLRQQLTYAALLNRIMFATSAMLDLPQIFQKICEEVAAAFDVPQAGIALVDEDRRNLRVIGYTSPTGATAIGAMIPINGNPSSEHVVHGGEPLYIADAQTDIRMAAVHELMARMGIVSILIIPIWSEGQVIGTLGLDAYTPRIYSDAEIATIEQICAAASHAVTKAQVYAAAHAELERRRNAEDVIRQQTAALRERSTPLLVLSEHVVLMPLIGVLDTERAQQVIEVLLIGIQEHQARTAILDITGVSVVDTHTAAVLIRAAQATRMLGARVMLTGIRPEVAQTLIGLGINLQDIQTTASLRQGIALALR